MKTEISNSEWVILRVLLNQSPLGSREIIDSIPKSNQWSDATVKTFLSRLVRKNIIGYRTEKNAFLYFPLVTEMAYVRHETKALYAKIYGGSVIHETAHFQFSGSESIGFIIKIATVLETNYSRITNDLSYHPTQKQLVYVHSSLKVMHSALGYENGPAWMTAGWFWEILHIAPEVTFQNASPEKASLHVFTQLMMHFVNPYAPFWLVEGIAVYEARWLSHDQIKQAIELEKDQLDAYSLFRVPTDFDVFKQQRGYELACSMIHFIVETYGKISLSAYLKAPENQRVIFSCSEGEFLNNWIDFLHRTYLNHDL